MEQISKHHPKVSIGIPVYNVEKYIERCSRSLFEQTYDNLEFIFVDDCSTDNTIHILNNIANDYPSRKIQIIKHHKNSGVACARNTALNNMSGDWVLWIDSDDWVEKQFVEIVMNVQEQDNADIVLYNWASHYQDKVVNHTSQPNCLNNAETYTLELIRKKVPYSLWGRLTRRALYTQNNISCIPGVNIGEDFYLSTMLAFYARKIAFTPQILYNYNCCNSLSLTKNGSVEQSWKTIDAVYSFFEDKGQQYREAIEYMRLWSVSCDLVAYGKNNSEHCFLEARKRLSTIDKKHYKALPKERRFILYFVWCPPFVKGLGWIMSKLNKTRRLLMQRIHKTAQSL